MRCARPRTRPTRLEDLPNVGPATAGDLRCIGITDTTQLVGRDPYRMFERLCRVTQSHHDPCVIDVFIACVRYMEGAPARPWWAYTAERKRQLTTDSDRPRSVRSVRVLRVPQPRRSPTRRTPRG